MAKNKQRLTTRQKQIAEEVFNSDLSEADVMANYNLTKTVYHNWLKDPLFQEEIDFHVQTSKRRSELIIARYAVLAAAKLVQLADSNNGETARKACMDIIAASGQNQKDTGKQTDSEPGEKPFLETGLKQLSAEKAAKLLDVLAQED